MVTNSGATPEPFPLQLLTWTPVTRNTLRGYASVQVGKALVIHDIAVHNSSGARWVGLPSKAMTTKDGAPRLNDKGKRLYLPLVEWRDKTTAARFRDAVIEQVEQRAPGAIGPTPAEQGAEQ